MNVGWQDVVALAVVAAAVLFLVRRARRVGRDKQPTGCGTCPKGDCPKGSGKLISIDLPNK